MKVCDLIEELKRYPSNMRVLLFDEAYTDLLHDILPGDISIDCVAKVKFKKYTYNYFSPSDSKGEKALVLSVNPDARKEG